MWVLPRHYVVLFCIQVPLERKGHYENAYIGQFSFATVVVSGNSVWVGLSLMLAHGQYVGSCVVCVFLCGK